MAADQRRVDRARRPARRLRRPGSLFDTGPPDSASCWSAQSGVSTICSQGAVIADVVGGLTGRNDPPSRKASTWVLGFTAGRLQTWDYYSHPTG